ncbi:MULTISPECIES: hypothetical protein [Micromonospora]|uniref:Lipoprotein n=1 Tax=Micromonospora yangpuensis TaxID=683228 RepID=A0A1C6VFW7_9ACTN|nr:hypothetical protein [Micromonospora yangpuensis]GGM31261.1 hypothetical protein GCM10012279_57690 [Micromonospora yangpuensis]SCL65199.1 hypothetical protein GA0070617_5692 [Micromonospora yangpuensis]
MSARLGPVRRTAGLLTLVLPVCLAACAADRPVTPPPPPGGSVPGDLDAARDELAARAAAAQDRHFTAGYALRTPGHPDRSVTVTSAADGTWRVDVTYQVDPADIDPADTDQVVDVSLAATGDGLYRCVLPSADRLAGCVRLGDPTDVLPHRLDPRVQHPFTDWLAVLTDRRAPLAVSRARPLPGVTGGCYAVESTSAALLPALDPGVYCYQPDGTLTAARTGTGTLTLATPPGPAPATVQLAGPVTDATPLQTGGYGWLSPHPT